MTDPKDADKRLLEIEKELEDKARSSDPVTSAGAVAVKAKVASLRSAYEGAGKTDAARKALAAELDALMPPGVTPGRIAEMIGEHRGALGMVGVGLAVLVTVALIAVVASKMGADAWKTIEGGRAILLIALTAAFVTFGGALTLAPLFEDGQLEERFRRAREVFLLFAGMFSTIVGFYFASATTAGTPASSIVIAESFDEKRGELQVSVTGGKPEYSVEVEYGAAASPTKTSFRLAHPGTASFVLARSEWPTPLVIRVTDSAGSKSEKKVTFEKDVLVKAGFQEPKAAATAAPAKPPEAGKTPGESAKAGESAKSGESAKAGESAKPAEAAKPGEGAKAAASAKPPG
ncbi:MAG TPA: hypothetical protein VFP36_03830 [Usitatibacter sp.]|nr:hypothetical protein [Usitatibacter sp.]